MDVLIFDLDHTIFAGEVVLHDGVAELLAIIRRLGVKIAGLSSGDHRMLVRLEEAGVKHYFDSVLTADQTLQPKHTSGVLHLLAELQTEPGRAAIVSHAHSDILLGKEAQLAKTIGVSHGSGNTAPLQDAGADHIVENIPGVLDVLE
ncbi:MAG TPA: HAD hydrolase-like protein [Candidatus Saccharimonadales bacterium]|nr:HAD hydrolase-like protein [Candidatus Saccharimonadales bacterium]